MSTPIYTSPSSTTLPKIKFYTNHGCGWSHRVHITLKELNLPYEEVLIDLDGPRPDWFLALNPRGLVPVLQYTPFTSSAEKRAETLTFTESSLIVTFLTTLHPSHLTPQAPQSVKDAHKQYLTSFVTDAYFTKVNPLMYTLVGASTPTAESTTIDKILTNLKTEVEPLLIRYTDTDTDTSPSTSTPYFLHSPLLTLAEVHIIPFSMRLLEFANGVIFPKSLSERIESETPIFYAWTKRCMAHPSIWEVWGDSEYWIGRIEERLPKARAKYADA